MAWARGAALRMSAGRRLAVVAPVVRVVYEAVELDPTRVVGAVVVDFVVAPIIAGVQRVRPVVVAGVVMVADRIRLAVQLGVPAKLVLAAIVREIAVVLLVIIQRGTPFVPFVRVASALLGRPS